MNDQDIKEAVEYYKSNPLIHNLNLVPLVNLAERYLAVKCPEKVNDWTKTNKCNNYNDGIGDYQLWLTKKLEGLEEVIRPRFDKFDKGLMLTKEHSDILTKQLATAIRKMMVQ